MIDRLVPLRSRCSATCLLLLLSVTETAPGQDVALATPFFPSQPITTPWTIHAVSGTPLNRVAVSCGCTAIAGPPAGTLIPAEGLTITLRTAFTQPGDHRFSATAFGSDAKIPISQVTYQVQVRDAVALDDQTQPWSKLPLVRQTDGRWRAVRHFRRGAHPSPWSVMLVDMPTVASGTPAWQAGIVAEGECWALTVTLDPTTYCGTWSTRVTCRFRADDGSALPYAPTLTGPRP